MSIDDIFLPIVRQLEADPHSLQSVTQTLSQLTPFLRSAAAPIDDYERERISRWLSRVIDHLTEIGGNTATNQVTEEASSLLAALLSPATLINGNSDSDYALARQFIFTYKSPLSQAQSPLEITIQDRSSTTIGAQTWNSAPVLAKNICAKPEVYFGQLLNIATSTERASQIFRILEIGAGTGLVGITAALVVHRLLEELCTTNRHQSIHVEIVLTDYASDVLENLAQNLASNQGKLQLDALNSSNYSLDVKVLKLDWADLDSSQVQGYFDVILGSDLVYEIDHAEWSAKAVRRYLKRLGSNFDSLPASPATSGTNTPNSTRSSTPLTSRAPSPDFSSHSTFRRDKTQIELLPLFHLLLPLRPTFARESEAVHAAYGSTFDKHQPVEFVSLPVRKSKRRRRSTIAGKHSPYDRSLRVYRVEDVEGIAHGQGCRDYQLLTVGWI